MKAVVMYEVGKPLLEQEVNTANSVRSRQLILLTGETAQCGEAIHLIAEHPATRWVTAYRALCRGAELAEEHDVVYNLEHLNTKIDHVGYPCRGSRTRCD